MLDPRTLPARFRDPSYRPMARVQGKGAPSMLGAPPSEPGVAVVRRGQTTSEIARAHGVTVADLVAANPSKALMRSSKGPKGQLVFADLRVGERLMLPAPTQPFLGNVCTEGDADYDQWECIKSNATPVQAGNSAAVVGLAVSIAGLAIVVAQKVWEGMEALDPDKEADVLACIGKGWAWDFDNHICADPESPIGKRAYCAMVAGTTWSGDECSCDGGLEWRPPTPSRVGACVPPGTPEPESPPPTPPAEKPSAGLSTTAKVLLGVGAVGAVAAAAAAASHLAKKKR